MISTAKQQSREELKLVVSMFIYCSRMHMLCVENNALEDAMAL